MVFSRISLMLIPFLLVSVSLLQAEDYVRVKAGAGDGVLALLRKYELDGYSCNLEHFYQINRLERNAFLQLGREYLLPIHIHHYNGRSIGSTLGISDWETRKRIQDYNERMLAQKLRTRPFQEDRVLWVPHHELNCPEKDLNIPPPESVSMETPQPEEVRPRGVSEGYFPIFGESYAQVPYLSNPRQTGRVYYLVGGHGGPDPGAIGKFGRSTLCEDEYAYDVTLRLARLLIKDGATVYVITRDPDDGIRSGKILPCDTDEKHWGDVAIHPDQKTRLTQRSDIINGLYQSHLDQGVPEKNQRVVIIHVDSRATNQRVDVFFYHQKGNSDSKSIARDLMQSFRASYKKYQPNRPYKGEVKYRDLFMIENCKPSTVYIELGNIRHPVDLQRILLEKNRQLVAQWLFEGLRK
jgi:N-acetylmuramoyl-L-alanine amidase